MHTHTHTHSLCPELPIDIVYTWVNGSDPALLAQLRELRKQLPKLVNNPFFKITYSGTPPSIPNTLGTAWSVLAG